MAGAMGSVVRVLIAAAVRGGAAIAAWAERIKLRLAIHANHFVNAGTKLKGRLGGSELVDPVVGSFELSSGRDGSN